MTIKSYGAKRHAPPTEPQFSDAPTVDEIFRARVFAEPLVPVGGEPTAGENRVLAQALLAFHRSGGTEWRRTIGDLLLTHPSSPWRAALLLNVGRLQVREHAYSRALDTWNQAWALAGTATDATGTAVADMTLAEWLTLAVRSGRVEDALARIAETQTRRSTGSAAVSIAEAKETLALMQRERGNLVPCGAKVLLALLASMNRTTPAAISLLTAYRAPAGGTSLSELQTLASHVGLEADMVRHMGRGEDHRSRPRGA